MLNSFLVLAFVLTPHAHLFAADWTDSIVPCDKNTPQFSDYPVSEIFKGQPAMRNIELIKKKGLGFFLGLEPKKSGKPNFAGFYRILEGGCGTDCQRFAAIDVRNGEPFALGLTSTVGIKFKKNSRLVILDPEKELKEFIKDFGHGLTSSPTVYFKWEKNQLDPICKRIVSISQK